MSANRTAPRRGTPAWFWLAFAIALAVNAVAGRVTELTIQSMRDVGEFANEVRTRDLATLVYWRPTAYVIAVAVAITYLWPLVAHFRRSTDAAAPLRVQRRVVNAPVVVAVIGFAPWLFASVFFPTLTLVRFGRWGPELMSQHVLSPLVNGFLAATTTYFLLDLLFRRTVVPRVFPAGRVADVPGTIAPGVRGRLLLFLLAVAFTPLFTMLGLVRAAAVHVGAGKSATEAITAVTAASTITFGLYVALGIGLTLLVAKSLTRPLGDVASALRRVQRGDLDVRVPVDSSDEVGVLEDGVNAMATALRDRERILQTFGRLVEPRVRDRLLAGDVGLGGERRTAAVLFCDLRGFTTMAEGSPPEEIVATLNEFFTVMTAWVRECGGFVDKFIGDAMLVLFGLFDGPEEAGRAAAAAIRCALGIHERLDHLNTARAAAARPRLAVTIGIHSGEVLAGTIGAADRHEYTVIGDTVNVAARLQEACKAEDGCAVLVSEVAYDLARAAGLDAALSAREGVVLRGRRGAIRAFAA